jgi:hypothetical protein
LRELLALEVVLVGVSAGSHSLVPKTVKPNWCKNRLFVKYMVSANWDIVINNLPPMHKVE